MEKKDYNGWTNYETWAVNLWMSNDQGSSEYHAHQAAQAYEDAEASDTFTKKQQAKIDLAEELKQYHELLLPELNGFASDLLNAAMSEVNWYEIAENLLEEYPETEPEDQTKEV
jgi:hypothetical protein